MSFGLDGGRRASLPLVRTSGHGLHRRLIQVTHARGHRGRTPDTGRPLSLPIRRRRRRHGAECE